MIVARTGMGRIPENCGECELMWGGSDCALKGCIPDDDPDFCPLASIDETLPAQLATAKADVAAAEERCKKFDRLLEFQEGDTGK